MTLLLSTWDWLVSKANWSLLHARETNDEISLGMICWLLSCLVKVQLSRDHKDIYTHWEPHSFLKKNLARGSTSCKHLFWDVLRQLEWLMITGKSQYFYCILWFNDRLLNDFAPPFKNVLFVIRWNTQFLVNWTRSGTQGAFSLRCF